jgi:hypothetical protein
MTCVVCKTGFLWIPCSLWVSFVFAICGASDIIWVTSPLLYIISSHLISSLVHHVCGHKFIQCNVVYIMQEHLGKMKMPTKVHVSLFEMPMLHWYPISTQLVSWVSQNKKLKWHMNFYTVMPLAACIAGIRVALPCTSPYSSNAHRLRHSYPTHKHVSRLCCKEDVQVIYTPITFWFPTSISIC